jgi:Zn finger protein HypA/HybF involved in hydrogenase expression
MEVLDVKLVGAFTVLHALLVAGSMFVVAIVWAVLGGPRTPPLAEHRTDRYCPSCSWSGTVSRHAPRCPKCGAKLPA